MRNYTIRTFKELPSTNLYALDNIDRFADADVILASTQSHGRGRLNRKWLSNNENNVYLSIVLKPAKFLDKSLPLSNITQYMAVVVVKLLACYSLRSQIKWPNDILIEGKKIAGILCETSIRGTLLKGIVLGIGINLDLSPSETGLIDQPATALNRELKRTLDKETVVRQLLDIFFTGYDKFLKNGFLEIKKDYVAHCAFIGKHIKLSKLNEIVEGDALGIDNDGALLFKNKITTKTERVLTGDLLC